jgi:hypothetical protein
VLVERAQRLVLVDLVRGRQRVVAQRDALGEGRHEVLQVEEDGLLELGAVILEVERRHVVARGEDRAGLRLMALGAVATADVDAFGPLGQVLYVPMSGDCVEMLEPGRIFDSKGGKLTGPVVVAEFLECKVQMFDILWENALGVTYEDQYGFWCPGESYL